MTERSAQSSTALLTDTVESTTLARLRAMQTGVAMKQHRAEPRELHEILLNLRSQSPSWFSEIPQKRPELWLGAKANIPRRHETQDITDRALPEWKALREGLCNRAGTGYLVALIGNRGTGKTQAAIEAVRLRMKIGQYALYVKAMEFFLVCRSYMKSETGTELDALAQFMQPNLLVIDEIGERGESAFEDRLLVYLIDKRYDAMLDTVLIANMKPEAMRDSLGASVWDRLQETGGIVQCNWESFRRKQTAGGAQ